MQTMWAMEGTMKGNRWAGLMLGGGGYVCVCVCVGGGGGILHVGGQESIWMGYGGDDDWGQVGGLSLIHISQGIVR